MKTYRLSAEETRRLIEAWNAPFELCAKIKTTIDRFVENDMNGYDNWKCADSDGERREAEAEAFEQRKSAILSDPIKAEAVDVSAAGKLSDETIVDMLSLYADMEDDFLVGALADGFCVQDMGARLQDVFARVARMSSWASALRAKAVSDAAEDDSDG